MVNECVHALCPEKQGNGRKISVTYIPKEHALRREILKRVGRDDNWIEKHINSKNLVLCNKHYEPENRQNNGEGKVIKGSLPRTWSEDVRLGIVKPLAGKSLPGYDPESAQKRRKSVEERFERVKKRKQTVVDDSSPLPPSSEAKKPKHGTSDDGPPSPLSEKAKKHKRATGNDVPASPQAQTVEQLREMLEKERKEKRKLQAEIGELKEQCGAWAAQAGTQYRYARGMWEEKERMRIAMEEALREAEELRAEKRELQKRTVEVMTENMNLAEENIELSTRNIAEISVELTRLAPRDRKTKRI